MYGTGMNGTIVNSTCGALIESGVPAIQAANVSVIPLTDRLLVHRVHPAVHWSPTPVRCQRSRAVQTARLSRAELGFRIQRSAALPAARQLHGGRPPAVCTSPCTHVVMPAMHAEGLEVSLDYSLGDQVKSLGSYAGVAATGLDQVMSMDSCKGDREHLALFAARHRHLLLSRRALRPVVLRSEI
jgi:hypothetical protein